MRITEKKKLIKSNKRYRKICLALTSLIIADLILIYFIKFPLRNPIKLDNTINNLIQFSGIYSALLITFIVSKIFQIRQERINRLKEILRLSNKVTDFRRICEVIYNEYDFWDKDMQLKMNSEFKHLSYFHIHIERYYEIPAYRKLLDSFNDMNPQKGASFFLALRSLVQGDNQRHNLELYDEYDHNIIYSFDIISKWYGIGSANSFFYYLKDKWHTYNKLFNIAAISNDDQKRIEELAKKIDEKRYGGEVFNRELLVNLGNHFNSEIFPRLFTLTYHNKLGITGTLNFLITNLITILIFGVFVPILLSSGELGNSYTYLFTKISVIVISITLFYFVIYFRKILKKEIKIDGNHF